MFETEGDTLANVFASDYGNYSDGFRKAFLQLAARLGITQPTAERYISA